MTRIQFPRFEYEKPPDAPLEKRVLVRRAPLRQWLSQTALRPLLDPVDVEFTEPARPVRNGWYGIYHETSVRQTAVRQFRSWRYGKMHGYRSRLLEHTYLWDHQALEGYSHELHLERQSGPEEPFDEILALFIPRPTPWQPLPGQRLLLRMPNGEWREPPYQTASDHRRDFYLAVATELAVRRALTSLTVLQ